MLTEEIALGEGYGTLASYVLDSAISHEAGVRIRRPAVVICPGGAFLRLSHRESEPVAARFLGMGYDAFICRYPVFDEKDASGEGCFPRPTISLLRALVFVRRNAERFLIDEDRIYVLGFSAGGYVALSVAELWDDPDLLAMAGATAEETKPRGAILAYPMVSVTLAQDTLRKVHDEASAAYARVQSLAIFGHEDPAPEEYEQLDLVRKVRPDMPRTFIWQTGEDSTLRVAETAAFVQKLLLAGVPCEFHLFQQGMHGMSLADETSASMPKHENARAAEWVPLVKGWLALDGRPQIVS